MYQINYLPWRDKLFKKKAFRWLYQTLFLITMTLLVFGYYTYHLVQKLHTAIESQIHIQEQENTLLQQIEIYNQEKQQTHLRYERYWLYYQNWYHSLHYMGLFRALETQLPATGWISQFSNINNTLSLHCVLPYEQSLFFISFFEDNPSFFSSFTLAYLERNKSHPSYTDVYFNGTWLGNQPNNDHNQEDIYEK